MRATMLFIFLFLSGCSATTFSYHSAVPYSGGALLGTGSYLIECWLGPSGGDPQRFNATFSRKAYESVFEAVSPGGKLLLQVRDPMVMTQEPAFRTPPTELAIPASRLGSFYRALRPLLLLADQPKSPSKTVTERYPDDRPHVLLAPDGAKIQIEDYDWDGHAYHVSLEDSGWTARVTFREYDIER